MTNDTIVFSEQHPITATVLVILFTVITLVGIMLFTLASAPDYERPCTSTTPAQRCVDNEPGGG